MTRPPKDVSETELAALQVLWERGPSTRRQIADVLYPGDGAAQYATAQKLLERLERKGHVRREGSAADGWQFVACVSRDQLITRRLHDVAEQLCGGSLTPILMNLVRTGPLSADEIDELRAFLREQGRKGGG